MSLHQSLPVPFLLRMLSLAFSTTLLLSSSGVLGQQVGDDDQTFVGFHTSAEMPFARSDMSATLFSGDLFADGEGPRIYLAGGCIANQVCLEPTFCICPNTTSACNYFTPQDDTWHPDGCADMLQNRYRHAAANVGGFLYVAGGRTVEDSIIPTIDRYNPVSNVWDKSYPWPNATSDGAAFGYNGTLYLVGGYTQNYNSVAALESFDPMTETFDYSLPPMSQSRGDLVVTPYSTADLTGVPDGVVNDDSSFYAIGGFNSELGFCDPVAKVERFSARSGTWSPVASLIEARGDLAVAEMAGSIFAIGGEKKDAQCNFSVPLRFVERYSLNQSSWDDEEEIPANLFRFAAASYNRTSLDSSRYTAIYLFGGQGTYEPEENTLPIKNSTLKYVPASTVIVKPGKGGGSSGLDDKGIAIVTIVVIFFCILLAFGIIFLCEYKRRMYYKKLEDDNDYLPHSALPSGPEAAAQQEQEQEQQREGTRYRDNQQGGGSDLQEVELSVTV